jgi:hypothetical protein
MTSEVRAMTPAGTAELRTMPAEPGWLTEPADCCRCRPRFCAQVPLAGRDEPADLLLCAYHLQISLARLAEIGAWVYDARNRRLSPTDWL